jgi:putative ABC transport system permease protein
MFLISSLLLNAGLMIFINFGGFFDETTKELNSSDTFYLISSSIYDQELEDFILNHENVVETQKEENLWSTANVNYNGDKLESFIIFNNVDVNRDLTKWKFVGEHLAPTSKTVYLPTFYKLSGGYELGDEFTLAFKDTTLTFTVGGFIEDIFFSSTETGLVGLYFTSEGYETIASVLGDSAKVTKLYVNLKVVNKDVESGIKKLTNADSLSPTASFEKAMFSLDIVLIKNLRIMMASMISMMIVSFAIMIAIVCLIVVRFRIGNNIEDDMTKIGSLKAIGYTSKQIVLSIVLQFSLIAFVGCFVGISLSYLTIPLLSDIFAKQSGFVWVQGFDAPINTICLMVILLIVVMVSLITARRIRKINPILALRGGLTTHSFRRNYIPLDKAKGNLSIVLAFKSMFHSLKQSIMIGIVCIAISFAGTYAVVLFYNTVIDIRAFEETPGIEISNALIILNPETDSQTFSSKVEKMNDVRKVQYIDETSIYLEETEVVAYIMKDYNLRETNSIYEGRYPTHNNEIAISGYVAQMINKKIEDTVTLRLGDVEIDFLITGLTQGASMGGMHVSITYDGVKKFNPDFKERNLTVYLNEGVDAAVFVKEIENLYSDEIQISIDMDKNLEIGTKPYVNIVSKAGISVLVITILIIILVLYFVINSSLVRRKRELGIQKAIGFTTLQLMNQISLGFLIPVIIGVIVGCELGSELTNPLMSIVQRSMGIMKANYIITPVWIALFGIAMVIISYITSLLVTFRIRKISAYTLVTE